MDNPVETAAASPAPIRVERYDGPDQEAALRRFAEDADRAAKAGYEVMSQVWEGGTLLVTYRHTGATRATAASGELSIPGMGIVAGGALVAVGSILPWVTAVGGFGISVSRSGIEGGDGLLTIVLGIGIALLGLTMARGEYLSRATVTLIASIVALAVVALDYLDITKRITDASSDGVYGSVGVGLWIVGVGAVIGAYSSFRTRSSGRR
jgi:hypothetical protein